MLWEEIKKKDFRKEDFDNDITNRNYILWGMGGGGANNNEIYKGNDLGGGIKRVCVQNKLRWVDKKRAIKVR